MNYIYKLTQNENTNYDTYDGFIVVANSEEQAHLIVEGTVSHREWCEREYVKVEAIAPCMKDVNEFDNPILLGSFNAG
jgi:hypothetical protein